MELNKNISVWRGNNTPPTDYHLWEKEDGSLHTKINKEWLLLTSPLDKSTLDRVELSVDNHLRDTNNPHEVTKALVGLDKVTNDALLKRAELGVASGVASLDSTGKIPLSLLPSYVDDFIIKGNTIKTSEIDFTTDTLQKFNDSISSGDHVIKTQYSVVDATHDNIVGQMLLIGDSLGHMVTEILITSAELKDGVIDWNAHSDTEVNTYIRRNHVKEGGTSSIAVGSWSKWNYYSGEGQYNDFKILVAGELSKKVNTSDVVQQTGDSITSVMSQKAVTDAIQAEIDRATAAEKDIIYDVSSHNNGAVFESLSALLSSSSLSTLIPTSVRHGGMSIRFIQGSVPNADNKYVQYRLMTTSFSTNKADWQGVDDEPTSGSDNLVKSGGVKKELRKKVNAINESESKLIDNSDGFYFTDNSGNVIAKILSDGLHVVALYDKDGNEIGSADASIESIKNKLKQDGFYFTDAEGNVIASIDKKGIHAVNIHEDGSNTTKSGWLNGKTIFSLCDSLGSGGSWQTLLAEMSGAKFNQELNGSQENMNNGTSLSMGGAATLNTLFYGYEGYPKGLSSQQQRAMNFVKLDETVYGSKDLLLIENINDLNYFRDVDKAEDITSIPSIFVKHTPIFKDRIFATAVAARDYFTKHYADVLTRIEPNVGTSLNFQIQTKGYDLTINSGATKSGTFTVNIGSESYPITVNSGMSAKEIAQRIYTFRFNGFKTSIDKATVKLTAELDDYIEATITCETDADIAYSLNRTESGLSYYQWVFKSHDVKDWLDISNWDYSAALGFISAVKGLFEYLATETPKTKIVYIIAPRFMHKWNKFLRADGTVDIEAYNNDKEVTSYNEFVKAQIKVCELYNIEYVNLAKELGWNQANMKRVYGESTIHWNGKGSEDIANYLFRKLN